MPIDTPQNQNFDYTALAAKYADVQVVDHDDLSSYDDHVIIKAFGENTESPRFMIGKDADSELTRARRQIQKLKAESSELRDKLFSQQEATADAKYLTTRTKQDRDYWRNEHSKTSITARLALESANNYETDLGKVRNHLGEDAFNAIVGRGKKEPGKEAA